MKKILLPILFFGCIIIPFHVFSLTIHIPTDYATIQEGIDASADGDVVLVEPGTYYEHINLHGRNITLASTFFTTGNVALIAGTIIDGGGTGRVITIDQGESSSCQVIGFTIQQGNSTNEPGLTYGGGVFISDASPQIVHCDIKNNVAPMNGGGLAIDGLTSAAQVRNCTIQNNTSNDFGGGVFMGDCSLDAVIINCVIAGNTNTTANTYNGGGGGVNLYHRGKLVNCLITGNSAPNSPEGGGGVYCDWGDLYGTQGIFITGCTITGNTAQIGGGTNNIINGGLFTNCIIWGNTDLFGNSSNYNGSTYENCCTTPLPDGAGNIDTDPAFVNQPSGNFRLTDASPCIDAGNSAFSDQATDLDGNPRVHGLAVDMGAYEFGSGLGVTVQIGSGTDVYEMFPIYSWYGYNYSQQIYLGSEISAGGGSTGLISKIRFLYSGNGSVFSTWNNWTVYLGNTSKTAFTGLSDWVPVSALQQVFSGLIPVPVPGTWLEIALPTPFYYSGGNLVVAVDENTPDYDEPSAQWGSFNSGTARGLITYNDSNNPDPASPPDASIDPDMTIAQVQFQITPTGILDGQVTEEPDCTVPIQGATIVTGLYSAISDALGHYQLALPVGTYTDITVAYHDASQTITPIEITEGNTTTQDYCLPAYYAPPVALSASISGADMNNVHLTWMEPGSVADQWIHWDNGVISGGLGFNAPFVFSVASRWPVADIAPYNGTFLKTIRFVPGEATASYTLKVWKGTDASTLLLSQVVNNPLINAWNEVALATPVLIDGTQEFWFGYEVTQTIGYPAGLGPGPAVAGKGDMVNSGEGWVSMKNDWNYDFNWPLQGFISENGTLAPLHGAPIANAITPMPAEEYAPDAHLKPVIRLFEPGPAIQPVMSMPRHDNDLTHGSDIAPDAALATMTGYNVYRNNAKIADNIPGLSYDDPALPKGGYDYEVSAQYDHGESARTGPVHVDIYTCFPPTALSVSNATLTTTSATLSWTPNSVSSNLQWDLEWGPSGFTHGNGTLVSVSATPSLVLPTLDPGTEYDFYVRTYCSASDASAWVKKTFRTHYFDCPAAAIAEGEVCGTNTNGCDQLPPAFGSISCGETVCGTAWLSRTYRDSDWYSFTIAQPMDVTLTGNAEFTSFMSIASAPCPSTVHYNSATNSAGWATSVVTQLGSAGTYYVYVAPAYAEQVACDSLSRYWVKITCNTCLTPTVLTATGITATTADLGWTSNGTSWNLEWGPAGFALGSGTLISGTVTHPYHLTGLEMGSAYSFYVQGDCGSGASSYWAGPYTFYTAPCPATSLPYTENFTGQTALRSPQCWRVYGEGGPTNWITDISNNAGSTFPELHFMPYNGYFQGGSFMTSPVINTTGIASLELSFKQYIVGYSAGTSCEVRTTSDGGVTWHPVWAHSQKGTYGPLTSTLAITTSDMGSSTFQFAFVVNGLSWDIGTWQIDDISLTGVPQTGTIHGVMTACSNAALLDGVSVTAGAYTTTTNASGFYQFTDIPIGTYAVAFTLAGYNTKSVAGVQVLNGLVTTLDDCLVLTGPPVTANLQYVTLLSGQNACYDATQTIIVAGSGTTFIIESGGNATMIAGVNIDYLPGTRVYYGGSMHGKIAPGGPYCGAKSGSFVNAETGADEQSVKAEPASVRIYPNPTNGRFRIAVTGNPTQEPVRVDIYGTRGERILSETRTAADDHEFSLAGKPAGIYFIKIVAGESMLTAKLIKTN